jgi:hypothetical protein
VSGLLLSAPEGTRNVTVEIVVGALVASVFVVIFLDIPLLVKILLVASLGVVGGLNFLALTHQLPRWREKRAERRRERLVQTRPDLISEFARLKEKIHKVLYERNANQPSLALDGAEIMEAMAKELGDKTLQLEFTDKLAMAQAEYNQLYSEISNRVFRYLKTLDFVEFLRAISSHLTTVNYVFQTVYRQSSGWTKDKPFPEELRVRWEAFRDEYNSVLHDWKAFTEKSDQSIGYGTTTQAENVKGIPQAPKT